MLGFCVLSAPNGCRRPANFLKRDFRCRTELFVTHFAKRTTTMPHVMTRLRDAIQRAGAPACVGIDPHLEMLPRHLIADALNSYSEPADALMEAVGSFCRQLLDVLADAGITIIKPQVAFFEALGPQGMPLFESVCANAQSMGMFVVGDVKRGDIGSTSTAYANGWLSGTNHAGLTSQPFSVDMITINPYLGSDGIKPFIDAAAKSGRGVFSLLKTSNPSSAELQDQKLPDGRLLYQHLSELMRTWGSATVDPESGYSLLGAVVGATHPDAARTLREAMPDTFFLVPGYGAQGAGVADLAPFFRKDGTGAVVNSSRGVIHAYGKDTNHEDWKSVVRDAAVALIEDLKPLTQGA